MVVFQSSKRKEKQRQPVGLLALLQKREDTRTSSDISSVTTHIRTIKTPTKTQSHRALTLAQIHSSLEGKQPIVATTPLGIHRPP